MKYSKDSIGRLIDRNVKVSRIWSKAIVDGDLKRGARCAIITRRLSKIVSDLLDNKPKARK